MNEREAMSFKALLRRIAAEENIPAQVVLQNFVFERLMERIVKSKIRNNFILKGGLLISHILGLAKRTTMDMDITVRNTELNEDNVRSWMNEIFSVETGDGVVWDLKSIAPIRDDDIYGGYRAKMVASLGVINVPLSVDISTGDRITPAPREYYLKSHFVQNAMFKLWGYTIETILAEKIESILVRGVLSTRPRDFYDVLLLVTHCKPNKEIFRVALTATAEHRGTSEVLIDATRRVEVIRTSVAMQKQWNNYLRTASYATPTTFDEVCKAVQELLSEEDRTKSE